jgi:predicted nucleic acid-binding protein
MLAAHAVTTIHYLLRRELGNIKAKRILSAILRVFRVVPVDHAAVQEALQLPASDFEDAVTAAAARLAGCECIVTREAKGFRGSPVRSLTPEAVTPLLGRNEPES